jgi:hypothetical protein
MPEQTVIFTANFFKELVKTNITTVFFRKKGCPTFRWTAFWIISAQRSYLLRDEDEVLDSERLLRFVVDELLFESSELLLRLVVVELLFESELLRLDEVVVVASLFVSELSRLVVVVELLRELESEFSAGRALEFVLRLVPVCVFCSLTGALCLLSVLG